MGNQLNLDYLREVTGGDKDIMIEMIDIFLSETESVLSSIHNCYQQENWMQLASEAHKIKPTLMYVGLIEVHAVAQQLEQNAKTGTNVEQYVTWISNIEQAFEDIKPQLAAEKARLEQS